MLLRYGFYFFLAEVDLNNDKIRAKVIAVFEFKDQKLISCDELTHLIEGSNDDRDMGSRS